MLSHLPSLSTISRERGFSIRASGNARIRRNEFRVWNARAKKGVIKLCVVVWPAEKRPAKVTALIASLES